MGGRRAATLAAGVMMCGALAATTAAAAPSGPPPPPKAASGHPVQQVAAGLKTPTAFAFGDGVVFEGDAGSSENGPPNGGVYVLKGGQATPVPGSPQFIGGLTFSHGTLYVGGGTLTPQGPRWQVQAWSGFRGTTFTRRRVIYTAPKRFGGFNGVAIGGDRRLYVGADVGLTDKNDHGPARTPYVYDILSMTTNGRGLKVFATGIRPPWQMVFPAGSWSPFVSDLGQDGGAKNPPDFLLRVRQGDNFGFPQCNRTIAARCKGFTKPFAEFKPHTDIMGLAIIGHRLYMSSFMGVGAKGPGGAVYSMPLSGGHLTPVHRRTSAGSRCA